MPPNNKPKPGGPQLPNELIVRIVSQHLRESFLATRTELKAIRGWYKDRPLSPRVLRAARHELPPIGRHRAPHRIIRDHLRFPRYFLDYVDTDGRVQNVVKAYLLSVLQLASVSHTFAGIVYEEFYYHVKAVDRDIDRAMAAEKPTPKDPRSLAEYYEHLEEKFAGMEKTLVARDFRAEMNTVIEVLNRKVHVKGAGSLVQFNQVCHSTYHPWLTRELRSEMESNKLGSFGPRPAALSRKFRMPESALE